MKLFFTAVLSLVFITNSFCQFLADTIFYDKNWEECKKENATFYRLYQRENNQKYYVEDYYLNGSVQMTGNYSSIYPERKEGKFTYYNEKGNITTESFYVANKPHGDYITYYENGNIKSKIKYIDGKSTSVDCYTENGSEEDCSSTNAAAVFTIVEIMPEFKGGQDGLTKYLQKNITYPAKARMKGIEGRVYVGFVVTATGTVTNVVIKRSVDPLLDAEALRVIKAMPAWKPGSQGGRYVSVQYNLPIDFKLQ